MTGASKQDQPGPAAGQMLKERAETSTAQQPQPHTDARPKELGGPAGPEPTRFGDWERAGRCVDF